jgi:hypothetical protein
MSEIIGFYRASCNGAVTAVGCLDTNDWFSAQAVVYTKGRTAWDKTPEDVPNFERMPPPPK